MSRKSIKFLILFVLTASLVIPFQFKTGPLPPIGKFFSPYVGFWQQAEAELPELSNKLKLEGLIGNAEVVYDDRLVPHIFAENDHDVYFLQGYVTAQNRLFQMDLQTRAAAGRLAEIIGEKVLPMDIESRRLGLKLGAERSLAFMMLDEKCKLILESYTDGVNAYINSLSEKDFPLEYKLLDFKPEQWSTLRIALLLKYMGNMLTGYENDFEHTNAVKLLGYDVFNTLFPDFPDTLLDPIIPKGTIFPEGIKPGIQEAEFKPGELDVAAAYPFDRPESDYGSNNWAISGSRTASGKPILCNDPHLGLNLPSIWFEIQLHTPTMNVYGASLPGAPCVISGFNDSIAWGITNAAMDVKDWYSIEFKDANRKEYLFDGEWKKTEYVVEHFNIRGKEMYHDTIIHTIQGPVAYDSKHQKGTETINRALRWTLHDPSKELLTFYYLNSGKNYQDYKDAISYFQCPGQNFVFASAGGDIAIHQQGKFVLRWPQQGRFVMDGTRSATRWPGYIPNEDNPHVLNPDRGWVSSANQHPTDESYPYYYTGIYEYFRNRRINDRLSELTAVKTEDMMKLQNDNFNLYAFEILPTMLELIDNNGIQSSEQFPLTQLKEWIYYNDPELKAPIYFETWWKAVYSKLWDEFEDSGRRLMPPSYFHTIRYIKRFPDGELIDDRRTEETESLKSIVNTAFHDAVEDVNAWKLANPEKTLTWANFKSTTVTHLTQLPAFSVQNVQNGGNASIVNATSEKKGPSWRMIVSPGSPGQAFGVYPGGQSGNPGSAFYKNFIDTWAKGTYYQLLVLQPHEQHQRIIHITRCAP
jgi:penicillin G amidase